MLEHQKIFELIKRRGGGRSGSEYLEIIKKMQKDNKEKGLTNKQMSFLNDIYEKFMLKYMEGL